jgi:hypothetical protein
MQNLDVFLSRLNPMVPGCPDPVAKQALVDSAISFCEDTNIIQYYSELGKAQQGGADYDVDLPAQTELARVIHVWLDDVPIPMAQRPMMIERAGWSGNTGKRPSKQWRYISQVDRGVIRFVGSLDEQEYGKPLVALIATRPTRDATQVDDDLFYSWAEGIVMGAVSRLAITPGTSFNSVDLAGFAAAKYASEVSRARLEHAHGRTVSQGAVVGRTFTMRGRR